MDDYIEINYVDSASQSIGGTTVGNLNKNKSKTPSKTDNVLTPYEYARWLSGRAKQIAAGMPPYIKWDGPFDPIAIAKKEIEQRAGSLVIVRKIPDGSKQGYTEEIIELKNVDIRDI